MARALTRHAPQLNYGHGSLNLGHPFLLVTGNQPGPVRHPGPRRGHDSTACLRATSDLGEKGWRRAWLVDGRPPQGRVRQRDTMSQLEPDGGPWSTHRVNDDAGHIDNFAECFGQRRVATSEHNEAPRLAQSKLRREPHSVGLEGLRRQREVAGCTASEVHRALMNGIPSV